MIAGMTEDRYPFDSDFEPAGHDDAPAAVIYDEDDDTLAIFCRETGEVLSTVDAPLATAGVFDLAAYLTAKLDHAEPRLAGLIAERQAAMDRIAARYDKRIARLQVFVTWLRTNPVHVRALRVWAEEALAGKKTRSITLAGLTLAFARKPGSTKVVDKELALACAAAEFPEAIREKVVRDVLVSSIPDDAKERLTADRQGKTGIVFNPPYDAFGVR